MNLELLYYFVKVVQNGSFSKAALSLKMPKSTLSKAVSKLEEDTGTKLLTRTTRSISLTAAGNTLYKSCFSALQTLENAQKSINGQDSKYVGNLKITAPEDLAHIIAPAISALSAKHADLLFTINFTNQVVDLVRDGYDLAIRIGKLTESNFKVKRVGDIILVAVASHNYVAKHKHIQHPNDLMQHACLAYNSHLLNNYWSFKSKTQHVKVDIKTKICCDNMPALVTMALCGSGVALVPKHLCTAALASGQLILVLPEWEGISFPLSIISPLPIASSVRLKTTTEFLLDALQKAI